MAISVADCSKASAVSGEATTSTSTSDSRSDLSGPGSGSTPGTTKLNRRRIGPISLTSYSGTAAWLKLRGWPSTPSAPPGRTRSEKDRQPAGAALAARRSAAGLLVWWLEQQSKRRGRAGTGQRTQRRRSEQGPRTSSPHSVRGCSNSGLGFPLEVLRAVRGESGVVGVDSRVLIAEQLLKACTNLRDRCCSDANRVGGIGRRPTRSIVRLWTLSPSEIACRTSSAFQRGAAASVDWAKQLNLPLLARR